MGKYAVLITLAAALSATLFTKQRMQTDRDAGEAQADRQKKVLARQIARSAFEMGISELQRDFHWRANRSGVEHEGGQFDLTVHGDSSSPVSLTAVGHHGDATYKITGTARMDTSVSALANGITASIPIDFDVSGGGCSGHPCVSGRDIGGREDRHGISLPTGADTDAVCDEFDDKVVGKGEGCDVQAQTSEEDDWTERKMGELDAEIQKAIDKGSGDVTVCDGCKVSDLSDSSGILYVTGELRYNGEESWDGLVFVADGGSVRINGGGDAKNINGGLMMSDSTKFKNDEEFDLNGGNAVRYNSAQLGKYMDTLPTLRRTTVRVTGRTGRFVRPSE